MTTRAFVLIETEAGRQRNVAIEARDLPDVKPVDVLAGTYDVVVIVEGDDAETVGDLVSDRIHEIDGVRRTMTCFSIDQSAGAGALQATPIGSEHR